jgi:hypothetical protein
MGVMSKHLAVSNETLLTFEAWKKKLVESILLERDGSSAAKLESSVTSVNLLLHFPDYNELFKGLSFNSECMNGISRAHQLRIAGCHGTDKCEIHYKEDIRVNGYFPRATQPTHYCREEWKLLFVHENPRQGYPEKVACQGTDRIAGQRLSWRYDVTFAGGEVKTYVLKGPSLPHKLCRADVLAILEKPLPHFPLKDFEINKLKETWGKVQEVIRIRGGEDDAELMTNLYSEFPVSVDDQRYTTPIANSILHKLYAEFGGEMRFKSYEMYLPRIAGCQIVDGITWKGGPLTSAQRDQALADAVADDPTGLSLLAGVRMRKRKRKQSEPPVLIKGKGSERSLLANAVQARKIRKLEPKTNDGYIVSI